MKDLKSVFDGFLNDLFWHLVAFFAATVALTLALWESIPWLWGIIKPWLHSITA